MIDKVNMIGDIITINYDFTSGTEQPHKVCREMAEKGVGFHTHDLSFFRFHHLEKYSDVVVMCKDGRYISAIDLLDKDNHTNTVKYMRVAHNINKMLIAGAFEWTQPI